MKNWKWLGAFVVILGLFIFGGYLNASAAELPSKECEKENVITFDVASNEMKEVNFTDKEGEEVTITIEPLYEISGDNALSIASLTPGHSHLFPYGTTKGFKISGNTPYLGMSYYVDVYIPKDTSGSKFTNAYGKDHWVIGGYLYDHSLTYTNKAASYDANVS